MQTINTTDKVDWIKHKCRGDNFWRKSSNPTPQDVVAASELRDQFMSHLLPLDREIIDLRLNGHSTADVARLIGQDPAFIRMRLSRLRRRLRDGGLMEEWL